MDAEWLPYRKKYILLGVLLGILFWGDLSWGHTILYPSDFYRAIFDGDSTLADIIWKFRLPKTVTCILAGIALSISGLLMQTLFRNPLAGPDVLGISSGASLFVSFILMIKPTNGLFYLIAVNAWGLALAATLGSTMIFITIIVISRIIQDNTSILIIGLMISAVTSAVVGVFLFITKSEDLQLFMIWSMGNVGGTNWSEILVLSISSCIGCLIALSQIKSLNGRLLGDAYAKSLGISLHSSRFWIVTATSLLTGSVTAFCGPIAFVGLAVPHLMRLIVPTSNHKILLPLVMMGGAILLLGCDLITRSLGTILLPLNAITSILGAPLVIWMILRKKKITT